MVRIPHSQNALLGFGLVPCQSHWGQYFIVAAFVQLAIIPLVYLLLPGQPLPLIANFGIAVTTVPLAIAVMLWFRRLRNL